VIAALEDYIKELIKEYNEKNMRTQKKILMLKMFISYIGI
jgi:hypothetical protein